ncbi:MAG: Fic family protein [Bacilli bacterium]|nr:Fic family protein [Bacilli bacterium]
MDTYKRVPLRLESHKRIYYNQLFLQKYIKRIEKFLEETPSMNTLEFATDALEYKELKSNNNIEGITDDIEEIEKTIRKAKIIPWNKKDRIINLHRGYRYILSHKNINKESLKELYAILSKGLLDEYSMNNMGDYYRNKPVYILWDGRLDMRPIKGIKEEEIDNYMNKLLDFINSYETNTSMDDFIKSQIIHFYFVYIHPYFDVNGRTARTLAMWYLLKEEAYPYIIFNRAISLNKSKYTYKLNDVRKRGDITLFLRYILKEVLKEFEKEKIISNIKENSDEELTKSESEILEYLLTLKGELTILDLASKYNAYNMYKTPEEIASSYIYPLIEKGVLINNGTANHRLTKDMPNIKLAISSDLLDINRDEIKSINIQKYISKQL